MDKALEMAREFSKLYGTTGIIDLTPSIETGTNLLYTIKPRVQIRSKEFFKMYGDREYQYVDRRENYIEVQIMDQGVMVFAFVDRFEFPERSQNE